MGLAELLVLGAQLDDLLLPWQIDLQLRHLIRHPGLLEHIDRGGSPCIHSRAYRLCQRSQQQMHWFAGLAQQARCFAVEGGQLLAAQLPAAKSDHAIGEIAA